METDNLLESKAHHGHALKRIRYRKGIKQAAMADMVEMSQQHISRIEAMPIIEDEILEKFAKALNVPVEIIKEMKEDMPSIVIENNTFNTEIYGNSKSNIGFDVEDSSTNTYNPVDKIIQLSDERAQLYERILKTEQEKNEALAKRLSELKKE